MERDKIGLMVIINVIVVAGCIKTPVLSLKSNNYKAIVSNFCKAIEAISKLSQNAIIT